MQKIKPGVIPPMVTPFDPSHNVDISSTKALAEMLVASGVVGIFTLGSSGEVSFLSDAERDTVVSTVVEQVNGRVPVLAGVIDTSVRRTLDHITRAAERGADFAVVTAPFYAKINDRDIENHFRAIADASPLPIVAYDIPVAVGNKLPVEVMMRLANEGAIVGLKDSSGNAWGLRQLVMANRAAGSPLTIMTGTEVVMDADLLIGADGAVPGLANVDPAGYVELFRLCSRGEWEKARVAQDRLARLFRIITADPSLAGPAQAIGAFKRAMKHQGLIDSATTAQPSVPLSKDAEAEVDRITAEHFNS